jgi:hypothetical protein
MTLYLADLRLPMTIIVKLSLQITQPERRIKLDMFKVLISLQFSTKEILMESRLSSRIKKI